MTYQPQPITITPEQIIAAAQLIVNSHDDAWEHTADEYLAATEHWLRSIINGSLAGANFYANASNNDFDLSPKCQMPRCNELALDCSPFCELHSYYPNVAKSATELVMPQPPEWAHDTIGQSQPDVQIAPDAQDFYDEAEYRKAAAEWERAHPVALTDDSTDAAIEWVHNTRGQGQQMSYNEWKNQGYSQEDIPPGI